MNREVPIAYIEPPPQPLSPSTHKPKSNLPMLYYGLVVVGTATIVLVIYNLIIIKWCTRRQQPRRRPNSGGFVEATTTASHSFDNINRNLLSSFKYRKAMNISGGHGQGKEQEQEQEQEQGNYEYECAVCLSVFEEGEEVRLLPRCKHSFHASCIDMWLYSHFDCPLCRTPVQLTRCLLVDSQEHSRENLLASGISPPNS